jgi:molybdopterin converting factor small subunit
LFASSLETCLYSRKMMLLKFLYKWVNLNFNYTLSKWCRRKLTEIFVKLMNKGLKYDEHNKFTFETGNETTVRDLIDELHEEYGERFEVYLEDTEKRVLRRDAVVVINGMNMVARNGMQTKLSKGDLIVFMIAAVGG